IFFFFSSRRRHTRLQGDWSSDVCSSDLAVVSVRLDEVMARDLFLVDVMLAEGPDQGLADDRPFRRAPGIRHPVHESGAEIGGDRSEERRVGKEWRSWWVGVAGRKMRKSG